MLQVIDRLLRQFLGLKIINYACINAVTFTGISNFLFQKIIIEIF